MVTLGSRGDVEPFIALGLGLRGAGHEVSVATGVDFEPAVRALGLGFIPVGGDMQAAISGEEGRRMLRTKNPVAFVRRLRRTAEPIIRTMQEDIRAAVQGADACVFSYLCGPVLDVHEATGLPCCMGVLQPMLATGEFPHPSLPIRTLGRTLNRLSFELFSLAMFAFFGGLAVRWRRERFHLPPPPRFRRIEKLGLPVLGAFSPAVIPRPADWPEQARVTGYWFMPPSDYQPSDELREFLTRGPAPVLVSFGSMVDEDPAGLAAMVEQALELADQRAVLVGGWSGLRSSSPRHFCVDAIPYDWLLPRVAAAVHHGGAGTTAAVLRAGVPSVAVPFGTDQPYWARIVHRLGAGPPPIPRSRLTPDRLARAITAAVTDDSIRARAAALGRAIRAEDGVKAAVDEVTAFLGGKGLSKIS